MNITVGLWPLLTTLAGWLFLFFGFAAASGKLLLAQIEKREKVRDEAQAARLEQLAAELKAETSGWRGIERELLQLKADLPIHYVRREDYVRGQSVLEAKLDALFTEVKMVQIKGVKHD